MSYYSTEMGRTEGYRTYRNMNERQVRDVSELYNAGDEGLDPREMRSTPYERQYIKEKRIMKYDKRERRWKLTLLGLGFVGFLILSGVLFYNRKTNSTTPTPTQVRSTTTQPSPTTVTTPEQRTYQLPSLGETVSKETDEGKAKTTEIPWMRETWEQESYVDETEPRISEDFVTQYGSTGTGGFLDFQNEIGSESTGGFYDIRESQQYQEYTAGKPWWETIGQPTDESLEEQESIMGGIVWNPKATTQPKETTEQPESIMSGITWSPTKTTTKETTENPNAAVLPWLRAVRRRK